MTPNQPYLMRALHEWILDNELTPNILVNAELPNVQVPLQSVQDGQIVLNISPQAITSLLMDNEAVSFSARFSGVVESIYIPTYAIKAIYASENGQGLVFPEMELEDITAEDEQDEMPVKSIEDSPKPNQDAVAAKKTDKKAPFLKVIK